jgi:hypothetical protein
MVMTNKEIVAYIKEKVFDSFEHAIIDKELVENQPNNNFYCSFIIINISVAFIKDRGYFEVEFYKDGKYSMLHEYEKKFLNTKLSVENLDMIFEYLNNKKKEYFI